MGSPVQQAELRLFKPVSEAELKAFMAKIRPYDVVRLKVLLPAAIGSAFPEVLLTDFIGHDGSDPELCACVAKLQGPVTFTDSRFGTFTLDRRADWLEAETNWGPDNVRLTFPAGTVEEQERSLAIARALWDDHDAWRHRMRDRILANLLMLKNEIWLEDNEPEVTADEFIRRLTVETVHIHPDGSVEFWHNDGDLFFGHMILVRGTLADGPTSASLQG